MVKSYLPRRIPWTWGAFLLWVGVLCGCADPRDRRELPHFEQVTIYRAPWEYRYGHSPISTAEVGEETFEWADPTFDDGGWRRTTVLYRPPGRIRQEDLWLRTRLTGPPLHEPQLFLEDVIQSYDAYLDGRLIASFGQFDATRAHRFPGRRNQYLPLGEQYVGKVLTLHISSPISSIGIPGPVRLGGRAELLVDVVRRGLSPLIVGAILVCLSLAALGMYFFQRDESAYLRYSQLAFCVGLYMVCRSSMRSFLFEEPVIWYYLELSSLCLTGAAICGFVPRILNHGPLEILRWMEYAFLALFIAALLLIVSGVVSIAATLRPLQYLWLLGILALLVTAAPQALRGNSDARIFSLGMLVAAITTLYELLQAIGLLPRLSFMAHYGVMAFMLSLAIILGRRVRAVQKRLSDFSTMLQLSFFSAEELQPGEHAQIAVDELRRMLSAERALLFLCRPGAVSGELELAAGRDARGNVMHELPPSTDHDRDLVTSALKKRRPFVREFRPTTVTAYGASMERSVVAAPLLARGRLLGVLYLEADVHRHTFGYDDVNILLGLGSQVALTLLAVHAVASNSGSEFLSVPAADLTG